MMHYKIVGVHDDAPDRPQVYRGTFQKTDEEPTMTALVEQFGTPGQPAQDCLREWSGGEVSYWLDDLAEDPNAFRWRGCIGDNTFHVSVGAGPME